MRAIEIIVDKNERHTIKMADVEYKFFGFVEKNIIREFIASGIYAGDYYRWLELPNKTIVPSRLSNLLNAWLRDKIAEERLPKLR